MKKLLQAASVAGLVLLGAVGCSNCCGSRTANASPPGQCPTGTPTTTTSHAATSGMVGTPMPTTMTTVPGKPPMMSVNTIPPTGAPVGTTGPMHHGQ